MFDGNWSRKIKVPVELICRASNRNIECDILISSRTSTLGSQVGGKGDFLSIPNLIKRFENLDPDSLTMDELSLLIADLCFQDLSVEVVKIHLGNLNLNLGFKEELEFQIGREEWFWKFQWDRVPFLHLIAQMNQDRVVGTDGGHKLPWRVHSDEKKVKEMVEDSIVIVGTHTFKNISRIHSGIPGSTVFVLGNDPKEPQENHRIHFCTSAGDVLSKALYLKKRAFCLGGYSIYYEMLLENVVNEMTISNVSNNASVQDPLYFPEFNVDMWETKTIFDGQENCDSHSYKIVQYRKKSGTILQLSNSKKK